jgi:hypothetical protein
MDRGMRAELVVAGTCDGDVDCEIFRRRAGNFPTPREIRYLRNFGDGMGNLMGFSTECREGCEVGFGGKCGITGVFAYLEVGRRREIGEM